MGEVRAGVDAARGVLVAVRVRGGGIEDRVGRAVPLLLVVVVAVVDVLLASLLGSAEFEPEL